TDKKNKIRSKKPRLCEYRDTIQRGGETDDHPFDQKEVAIRHGALRYLSDTGYRSIDNDDQATHHT
ncbi:hypothetical protein PM022_20160, partial [Halorubrum ezzemoulense]|uniref:hypothetical protein n=1 Tax=Halorubrum ezzemoulense TaxID=337243 RepID=UPI00232BB8F4